MSDGLSIMLSDFCPIAVGYQVGAGDEDGGGQEEERSRVGTKKPAGEAGCLGMLSGYGFAWCLCGDNGNGQFVMR